ncbi:MAG: TIGR02302 family protein [Rhizobiales bacterium]|nr:TIGR02302 family protein [Hyphomicrobiales bacterium]MBO6699715.1 TIGR02302 family protein [Hyphomicrobiales bacterium]MBO6737253.1 TIGR02302 family protein [Hyphomicrobiales bacterium]MBO6911673.1 TIGR02302 family protein [Hyphomicrobiales bacterium]MBO6954905.1 TIGR02302 family protein [Hyphomicrobiales bacterium]
MPDTEPLSPLSKRITRATRRAMFFAFIERLWPRLVVAGSVLGIFLSLSWLGLWPVMPDIIRFALLGILAVAFLASLVWAGRTPRVPREQGVARVEAASGLQGRPLSALEDTPFDTRSPQGRALWRAHQAHMADRVKRLAAGLPAPRTELLDRWALRAPVLLVLVVAFFVAGPQRTDRIVQAFAPPQSAPTIPVRIDVWATPPAYTGLPPRTLLAAATFQEDQERPAGAMLPTGSRLTILLSEPEAITATLTPMTGSGDITLTSTEDAGGLEANLTDDVTLGLASRQGVIELPILITPDTPPTIRFAGEPQATAVGAIEIFYQAEDDYAVESAHADVEPADERFADATPLITAPRIDLILPPSGSSDTVETTRDLSAHPWAGLEVDMTLVATDGASQEATSDTITVRVPERPFREPLARALVEQRRLLAVDTRTRPAVLTALEGLALAPEDFMEGELSTFLALTVTTQRLRLADTEDGLLAVVDMLWQLALQVEDGDLSLAAERLREAEENLADALENGASDEEIATLMDELRQAFQEYMQALAERLQNQDMAQMPQDMPMANLNPLAMQDMMDQIQNLAELGASEAARELLEQLREQLDQLRGAQAMEQREPTPQEQQLRESVQELQAITREQQRLLDETFPFSSEADRQQVRPPREFTPPGSENDQAERPDGNQNSTPDNDPLQGLSQEQQALEERLRALMDELRDLGLDPEQFGEAGDAMEGAGERLGEGDATTALGDQGRALEALRQGAQDMMEQLAEGQGQGGEGQAQGPGQSPGPGQGLPRITFGPGGDGQRGTDPLGRPQRETGGQRADGTVRIPEESDIQRARDILNEIQRRLGEQVRPQVERDYLDRLIDRF